MVNSTTNTGVVSRQLMTVFHVSRKACNLVYSTIGVTQCLLWSILGSWDCIRWGQL